MVILRDLAQKDRAGSSKGEAHLLPIGTMPTSAISCQMVDHDSVFNVAARGDDGCLEHTYEGHLACVNEGAGAQLVVDGWWRGQQNSGAAHR